jgi:DNA repair protein RadC
MELKMKTSLEQIIGQKAASNLLAADVNLEYLTNMADPVGFLSQHGVSSSRANHLLAALALHEELNRHVPLDETSIDTPLAAYRLFGSLKFLKHEETHVAFLNSRKEVIAYEEMFRGGLGLCVIDPRVIWERALAHKAIAVIMAHNHPSGTPYPSQQDLLITERCAKVGQLLQIELVDHLVLTRTGYHSIRESHTHIWD